MGEWLVRAGVAKLMRSGKHRIVIELQSVSEIAPGADGDESLDDGEDPATPPPDRGAKPKHEMVTQKDSRTLGMFGG